MDPGYHKMVLKIRADQKSALGPKARGSELSDQTPICLRVYLFGPDQKINSNFELIFAIKRLDAKPIISHNRDSRPFAKTVAGLGPGPTP